MEASPVSLTPLLWQMLHRGVVHVPSHSSSLDALPQGHNKAGELAKRMRQTASNGVGDVFESVASLKGWAAGRLESRAQTCTHGTRCHCESPQFLSLVHIQRLLLD